MMKLTEMPDDRIKYGWGLYHHPTKGVELVIIGGQIRGVSDIEYVHSVWSYNLAAGRILIG